MKQFGLIFLLVFFLQIYTGTAQTYQTLTAGVVTNLKLSTANPTYFKLDLVVKTGEQVYLTFELESDHQTAIAAYAAHESYTSKPCPIYHLWKSPATFRPFSLLLKDFGRFSTPIYYFMFLTTGTPTRPLNLKILVGVVSPLTSKLSDGESFKFKTEKDSRELIYAVESVNTNPLKNVFTHVVEVKISNSRPSTNLGWLSIGTGELANKITFSSVVLKSPLTSIEFSSNLKNVVSSISTSIALDVEITWIIESMTLSTDSSLQIDYKRTDSKYQFYKHTVDVEETYVIQPTKEGTKINKFYANFGPSPVFPTAEKHHLASVDVTRAGDFWGSYISIPRASNRRFIALSITQKKGDEFYISNEQDPKLFLV
jgi:hypothetical protein